MSLSTARRGLGGTTLALLLLLPAAARGEVERASIQAEGLRAPVEIRTDHWGISHIYARNEADLFFAQGFSAARDRLFQFELWRRQATGTVAELLGRRELERDIGARLHTFRGDLEQELNHYHPRGVQIITAFVEGINAYVEHTERQPELLPLEFELLGIRPGKWTAEVVISRHQGLLGNVEQELDLGRAVARLGPEKVRELSYFHPGEPELALDEAIDGELLEADILRLYRAFRRPLRLQPEDLAAEHRAEAPGRPAAAEPARLPLPRAPDRLVDIGSNNWVVSGRLTQSGRPLLANDPHRALHVPSLRYFVHLVAPGWNVIGGGEPVLPGVSIGHNGYGAWGLTVFRIDGEDLYVYDTHPDDPLRYRYQGQWERMRTVRETIPVKGEEPVVVDLKYTRHGPVLHEDAEHHKAYALRAAWREIGSAPYLASLRMNVARSWDEFREACRYSYIPGENMVWADRDGNIGWQAVGIAPLRRNWSGLVPVPGDGRYEWDGYLPVQALPHVLNPEQGFWSTANQNLVPPGYPHRNAAGWTWADPYRAARVHERLASGRRHSLADMIRLQQDELSLPARQLVPLLHDLPADDAAVERAIRRLLDWDYVLDRRSVPAGIYVAWERRLHANLRKLLVPEPARPYLGSLSMKKMIDWLLAPDGRFGPDPLAGRDGLLLESLEQALGNLTERLGPDWERWQYGQPDYKHARIRHPLSQLVDAPTRDRLDVGPLPRGGNQYTVNNTGGADNQTSGATFRVIVDTDNWDNSLATSAPGQSGDPDSPHYRDLFALWATGKYFPLCYTRQKVESVTRRITVLDPK